MSPAHVVDDQMSPARVVDFWMGTSVKFWKVEPPRHAPKWTDVVLYFYFMYMIHS